MQLVVAVGRDRHSAWQCPIEVRIFLASITGLGGAVNRCIADHWVQSNFGAPHRSSRLLRRVRRITNGRDTRSFAECIEEPLRLIAQNTVEEKQMSRW